MKILEKQRAKDIAEALQREISFWYEHPINEYGFQSLDKEQGKKSEIAVLVFWSTSDLFRKLHRLIEKNFE